MNKQQERSARTAKVFMILGLGLIVFIAGIMWLSDEDRPSLIDQAEAIIKRQVASDIEISFDKESANSYDPGGRFAYVCSTATLNRPGSGPLALNNKTERVIVTVNSQGNGAALFDGSSDANGRAQFELEWSQKCG